MIRRAPFTRVPAMVLTAACFWLAVSGCSGIRNDYPEKASFRMADQRPESVSPTDESGSPLLVKQLGIAPEFESDAFVYRTGANRFASDFYHSFVVPPARMITDIVKEHLYATERFAPAGSGTTDPARYQLSGKILDLYADLRDSHHPQAVIALRLMLDTDTGDGFEPVVHKVYREAVPFADLDPDQYIQGLNKGLARILTQFSSDLAAVGAAAENARTAAGNKDTTP